MLRKFLFSILTILFLCSTAQAIEVRSLGISFGVGIGSTLDSSPDSNHSDMLFKIVEIETELVLIDTQVGELLGVIGAQGIFIEEPEEIEGAGGFLFTSFKFVIDKLENSWVHPYILCGVGAGGVDVNSGWDKQADGLNFVLQIGGGVEFGNSVALEYRLHHISNASLNDPNRGVNSSLFLFKIPFYLEDANIF